MANSASPRNKPKAQVALRSLGTWFFDKRSRKRKYVSLTGKVLTGQDAVKQSRTDQFSESHPAQQIRTELCLLAVMTPVDELLQAFRENQTRRMSEASVASNSSPSLHLLSSWGIPDPVLRRYRSARITELFPWQIECLLTDEGRVLSGHRNLIYTAPTSGGKTLVAELLMLRKLAATMSLGDPKFHPRRTIFFVVPFIALAEEKLKYFQYMWQDMNIGVKGFHTDESNTELGEDVELVICTIERANILVTQLLDARREDQLSMIIIDEIHLLSDKQRGFLLEVLLSKVKYILGERVQLIGMSATLPNIQDLATWLQASLYMTTFRPVALKTLVCDSHTLYEAFITYPPNITSVSPASKVTQQNNVHNNYTDIDDGNAKEAKDSSLMDISLDDAAILEALNDMNSLPSGTTTTFDNGNNSNNYLPKEAMNSSFQPGKSVDYYIHNITQRDPTVTFQEIRKIHGVSKDDDGLLRLCLETLQEEKSCLLFCNSKHRCEVVARKITEAARAHQIYLHQQQQKIAQLNHQQQQNRSNIAATFRPPPPRASSSMQTLPSDNKSFMNNVQNQTKDIQVPGILSSSSTVFTSFMNNSSSNSNYKNHQNMSLFHNAMQELHLERQTLLTALSDLSVGICPILRETIPFGIAYHHAGLTQEERCLLEDAFRSQRCIKLLVTTSTLSAGVNLPAHRVILRGLSMGDRVLNVATFKQMCGRAGRTGMDVQGEAIVMLEGSATISNNNNNNNNNILNSNNALENGFGLNNTGNIYVPYRLKEQRVLLQKLLTAPLDPLSSSLAEGYGGGIEKLLLEMIVCRRISQEQEVIPFMQSTLFYTQHSFTNCVLPAVKQAMSFLKREQFIQNLSNTGLYASPLGKATTLAGLSPQDAVLLLPSLQQAKRKVFLHGSHALHLIYLLTPIHHTLEPTWSSYEALLDTVFKEIPQSEIVAQHLNIHAAQAQAFRFAPPKPSKMNYVHHTVGANHRPNDSNANTNSKIGEENVHFRYKRFYNAILLFLLMEDWPVSRVMQLFTNTSSSTANATVHGNMNSIVNNTSNSDLGRGKLQQLQRDASVFGMMLLAFTQALNWPLLHAALQTKHAQLAHGTQQPHLLPLMRLGVELMPAKRAKWLYQQYEISSPDKLLTVSEETLAHWLWQSLPYAERDVLDLVAANNNTNNNSAANIANTNNNESSNNSAGMGDNERTRSQVYQRSLRLARCILARAEAYVAEDMRRLRQSSQPQQQQYI